MDKATPKTWIMLLVLALGGSGVGSGISSFLNTPTNSSISYESKQLHQIDEKMNNIAVSLQEIKSSLIQQDSINNDIKADILDHEYRLRSLEHPNKR